MKLEKIYDVIVNFEPYIKATSLKQALARAKASVRVKVRPMRHTHSA
jgi:hypothetical protein